MNEERPSAIIADDEAPLRAQLRSRLARLWPELQILAEAGSGQEAVTAIETSHPDLAFLDIRMPGLSGLDVARRTSKECHIIFITAYERYAVEAFESEAVDYLLKPVNDERLAATIERLQSRLNTAPPDLTALLRQLCPTVPQQKNPLKWLKIACPGESIQMISVKEVDYFKSAEKYTSVYANGKEYIIRMTIKELEAALDPDQFWRIHRSTIIRVAAVKRATRNITGRYFVELRGLSKPFPVSRNYAHLFKTN